MSTGKGIYYKVSHDSSDVYGPFPEEQVISWYDAGYFGDLVLVGTQPTGVFKPLSKYINGDQIDVADEAVSTLQYESTLSAASVEPATALDAASSGYHDPSSSSFYQQQQQQQQPQQQQHGQYQMNNMQHYYQSDYYQQQQIDQQPMQHYQPQYQQQQYQQQPQQQQLQQWSAATAGNTLSAMLARGKRKTKHFFSKAKSVFSSRSRELLSSVRDNLDIGGSTLSKRFSDALFSDDGDLRSENNWGGFTDEIEPDENDLSPSEEAAVIAAATAATADDVYDEYEANAAASDAAGELATGDEEYDESLESRGQPLSSPDDDYDTMFSDTESTVDSAAVTAAAAAVGEYDEVSADFNDTEDNGISDATDELIRQKQRGRTASSSGNRGSPQQQFSSRDRATAVAAADDARNSRSGQRNRRFESLEDEPQSFSNTKRSKDRSSSSSSSGNSYDRSSNDGRSSSSSSSSDSFTEQPSLLQKFSTSFGARRISVKSIGSGFSKSLWDDDSDNADIGFFSDLEERFKEESAAAGDSAESADGSMRTTTGRNRGNISPLHNLNAMRCLLIELANWITSMCSAFVPAPLRDCYIYLAALSSKQQLNSVVPQIMGIMGLTILSNIMWVALIPLAFAVLVDMSGGTLTAADVASKVSTAAPVGITITKVHAAVAGANAAISKSTAGAQTSLSDALRTANFRAVLAQIKSLAASIVSSVQAIKHSDWETTRSSLRAQLEDVLSTLQAHPKFTAAMSVLCALIFIQGIALPRLKSLVCSKRVVRPQTLRKQQLRQREAARRRLMGALLRDSDSSGDSSNAEEENDDDEEEEDLAFDGADDAGTDRDAAYYNMLNSLIDRSSTVAAAPYVQYIFSVSSLVARIIGMAAVTLLMFDSNTGIISSSGSGSSSAAVSLFDRTLSLPLRTVLASSVAALYLHGGVDNYGGNSDAYSGQQQQLLRADGTSLLEQTKAHCAFRIAYLSKILLDPFLLNECSRFKIDDYIRYLLRLEQQRLSDIEERYKARQLVLQSSRSRSQNNNGGFTMLGHLEAADRLPFPLLFRSLSALLLLTAVAVSMQSVYCKVKAYPMIWKQKDQLQNALSSLRSIAESQHSSSGINILHAVRVLVIQLLRWVFVAPFQFVESMLQRSSQQQQQPAATISSALGAIFKNAAMLNSVLLLLSLLVVPVMLWLTTMQSLAELSVQASNILAASTPADLQHKLGGVSMLDTSGLADLASYALRAEPTHEDDSQSNSQIKTELIYPEEVIQLKLQHSKATSYSATTAAAVIGPTTTSAAVLRTSLERTVADSGWTADGPDIFAGIELSDVTAAIDGKVVLQDFSCTFPAGKITAILADSEDARTAANALLSVVFEEPRIPDSVADFSLVPVLLRGKLSLHGREKGDWNARSMRERLTFTRAEDLQLSVQAGAVAGCLPGTSGIDLECCMQAQEASGASKIIKQLPDGPATILDPASSVHDDLAVLIDDTKHLKYVPHSHSTSTIASAVGVGAEATTEATLIRDMVARSNSLPSLGKTHLSNDQWSILHVSRALSKPSRPVLLLSLPTKSMSEEQEAQFFAYLRQRLTAEQTIVLTSTRAGTLQYADHAVLVAADGRIREESSVIEVKETCVDIERQLTALTAHAQAKTLAEFEPGEEAAQEYYQSVIAANRAPLMDAMEVKSPLAVRLHAATRVQ